MLTTAFFVISKHYGIYGVNDDISDRILNISTKIQEGSNLRACIATTYAGHVALVITTTKIITNNADLTVIQIQHKESCLPCATKKKKQPGGSETATCVRVPIVYTYFCAPVQHTDNTSSRTGESTVCVRRLSFVGGEHSLQVHQRCDGC